MKIFIPSYGRAHNISTPFLLDGLEWQVVVHDKSEFNSYVKRIPRMNLAISNVDLGVAKQRNWILENLVGEDEWFCFMDDNIKTFWKVHPGYYEKLHIPTELFEPAFWARRYTIPTKPELLMSVLEETKQKADSIGARLAGFATTDNPFFRKQKWRSSGFVCTKTALVKKGALRFDEAFFAKDDVDFSAQNIDRYGCVLVNNYIYPNSSHHQLGGIGNKRVRDAYSATEAQMLVQKWPELCSLSKTRQFEVVFKHGKETKHDSHAVA